MTGHSGGYLTGTHRSPACQHVTANIRATVGIRTLKRLGATVGICTLTTGTTRCVHVQHKQTVKQTRLSAAVSGLPPCNSGLRVYICRPPAYQ
jgi:hypothetical protein